MHVPYGVFLTTLLFALCPAQEIPDCDFEDTVDLTHAQELPDGSFLYENILIPPDQVGVYEYEEYFDGDRVFMPAHNRGCLCKNRNCIKFCCEPTEEDLILNSRECQPMPEIEGKTLDLHVNVRYANGSKGRAHATKDFTVIQGIPCLSDAVLDAENNVLSKWEILENGSLYMSVDRVVVSKRDYCLLVDESGHKNRMVLMPLDCKKYMPLTVKELINDICRYINGSMRVNIYI